MAVAAPIATPRKRQVFRIAAKTSRKALLFILAGYFLPEVLAFFLCCGLVDVLRNTRRTFSTLDRYFAGNGFFTWLLSPFNLFMDLISLPYWNKGVYAIPDLPKQ